MLAGERQRAGVLAPAAVAEAHQEPESSSHRSSQEDWSTTRAVASGAAAQLVAKAASLVLNVVMGLALIRYFSTAAYGDYVFVLSFTALFGLLSDFGIAKVAVRDMSQRPGSSARILGTAIAVRLALCVVSVALAQVVLLIIGGRVELRPAVAVASLLFVSDALLSVVVVFQVRLANQYEALVTVVVAALKTGLTLWLIGAGASLVALLAVPVVSGFVGVALAMAIARLRFQTALAFDASLLPALAGAAVPLGITALLATLYVKLDSVLLGVLASPSDVGLYGAGYKPVEYLLLVGAMLVQLMFPLLARWYRSDPVRFLVVYRRGAQALLAFVLPVPIVAALIAEPLVLAMYAPAFVPSAVPLRVLSAALVLLILGSWQSFALLAAGRQRIALLYDAAALVVNVVLNVALILWIGYVGAAITAVATAAFVCVCATFATWRVLGVTLDSVALGRVVLANLLLGGTLLLGLVVGLPWTVATVLAGLCYPLWLLACRVATVSEVRMVLRARSVG
jgi:O-antigen/teichoic acid export membrane protein